VAAVALLLFGTRLPKVMRSLGEGIVEFKRGVQASKTLLRARVMRAGPTPVGSPQAASMFGLGPFEIGFIGAIAVTLYGERLPEVGRNVGKTVGDHAERVDEVSVSSEHGHIPLNPGESRLPRDVFLKPHVPLPTVRRRQSWKTSCRGFGSSRSLCTA
jgi:Sec-independent protein translocase protein TatA